MTIDPHGAFDVVTPDEVAECWDGVPKSLYARLWECLATNKKNFPPKYDAFGEYIGPEEPVIGGSDTVANNWNFFTDEEKAELNRIAEAHDSRHHYWNVG